MITQKRRNRFLAILLAATFSLSGGPAAAAEPGQVAIYVARLLEQGHFTRQPLDDKVSARLLQTYLESLDYNRLFFTEEDIARLRTQYSTELDDYLLLGNPRPAQEIFELFRQRVRERTAFAQELLKEEPDFTSNRVIEISRQKSPWPRDTAEAEQLWRDRITGELLQARLNEHAADDPVTVVSRRYRQVLRNVEEQDDEDALSGFLSALARVYDPHSEYLDPGALENFEISMKNSLVGIGAVLRSEDGYALIMDLVAGGPAQIDGRLEVNDRISAVAQGDEEFNDVVDMPLDKVVNQIRGKKGTLVRLQVLPASATDPSMKSVIELVRDEVQLKEQDAKAEIIDRTGPDGRPERIGWITLPQFYADMERSGRPGAKSTTRDVARLLERLEKENIDSLIIDLRRNGGGSLEEAVNFTGLFLGGGPVVQAKNTEGDITVSRAPTKPAGYEGPLVVLTSRLSASASEIFAGALQDYGRAVLVGDRSTFGKGTVQTMLKIGQYMSPFGFDPANAGALKLTIQQFYRVSGGSTQLRGVVSDIVLPTITDDPKIGESALKNPLPYDEIDAVPITPFGGHALPITELARRSDARVAESREFGYVREDVARRQVRLDANAISLNEPVRRTEIEEEKARGERRKEERLAAAATAPQPLVYTITLDNVDVPQLQKASNEPKKKPSRDPEEEEFEEEEFDSERHEALNIASDLARLTKTPKTAQTR